ncbi:MAG TPA: lysophospholipid acyltransferase family protein [Candidatus Dormibacteraeota bacterium]|nr:lysophospholipid acyltransferase family protein [Candidatus Dormibacteraeota bacterium]
MIRTLAAALFSALAIVFLLPWLIAWTAIVGNPDFMYSMSMKFIRIGVRIAGIRFRVDGLENIPAQACVFACNHASNADPPVLVLAIPRRVSILAKREVFRIPILGFGMRHAGFVPVDRRAKEGSVNLDEVAKLLKSGVPLLIFAEGTRSPDGRLRPFKKGAALMAIHAGAPIVPTAIAGTPRIMPKGEWRVHPGEVTVRFCPSIDASQYTIDQRAELVERMEAAVAAALPPDQQPLPRATGEAEA